MVDFLGSALRYGFLVAACDGEGSAAQVGCKCLYSLLQLYDDADVFSPLSGRSLVNFILLLSTTGW